MYAMKRPAAAAITLTAITLTATVLAVAPPAAAASGRGSCFVYQDNRFIEVDCQAVTGTPGNPDAPGGGSGGSGLASPCVLEPLSFMPATVPYPAPKGDKWMWLVCREAPTKKFVLPGTATLVLVPRGATTADPGVTPQELLQIALGELRVPAPDPATAPPRGKDGLVGLPEWFWIPRSAWHQVTITVTVGPVFATVTASPGRLTFSPGAGLSAASCAGPGTAYNPQRAASAQHTACSYTYDQSSDGQPGDVYQASVSVTWRITWVGSGGTGGVVNAGFGVSSPMTQRVAAGEALVTNP
jgi:hypothetical protein